MQVITAVFVNEATRVSVTMSDGSVWTDDAALPPDNQIRRLLAEWLAAGGEISAYVPPEPVLPPPPVPVASVVAMAELQVDGEDISGVATACNVGAAMAIDVGLFWIFFTDPEPDTAYLAFVQSPGYATDVTMREAEFFEISVTNRLTGEPAVPASLSISVQRVR